MALGFATVNLNAAQRITANHRGSLSVYQSQGVYVEGSGYAYQGGNLNLYTPLITGEAGSVNRVRPAAPSSRAGPQAPPRLPRRPWPPAARNGSWMATACASTPPWPCPAAS